MKLQKYELKMGKLLKTFEVFGLKDNEWQKFKKESTYDACWFAKAQAEVNIIVFCLFMTLLFP